MAGKHLKKAVMELGGSDPFLVLKDADVDHAVNLLVASRMTNCGQICFSAKRIIVHSSVYDQVLTKLKQRITTLKMGDPLDESSTMSPLCSRKAQQDLDAQMQRIVNQGGVNVVCGGKI
mmetsp:Transcript_15355/g.33613  ORF Transcript_15355/g.33613 Transcript_15355/m.33613 type:complete len:119 (-) Transcript_15355:440-796(-)|eukprot:CAMPEP_0116889540 /NCGR_PEP_ID=MMETSP0467-20121206/69_1 /TAXON_ID=283647 /ORGANISM="Mesodinium pulex, Strain SPMC105" /LENGTH=118 /DNA_ID=CAMNT_0004556383 /DNA_START=643 /DNA_END=999 /DNA_ORIENTATION=-